MVVMMVVMMMMVVVVVAGDDLMLVACWCQHWFEYFPNPPINVLSLVENVLAYHDKELLHHFVRHGVTSQVVESILCTFISQHISIDF